ncbi:hypothetical protein EDB80DRAFT_827286 [Ilyonectria destructans]|nr:hypothetical protein EDB80DRAFT_827286 [Ilyonectria destructans]
MSQRASNVCKRCRRRKVRCTGSHPCTNCSRKNLSCHFDGQGRKVVISQKYLQEIQRAAARPSRSDDRDRATSEAPAEAISFGDGHDDAAPNQRPEFTPVSQPTPESAAELSNPLASPKSSYVLDDKGRLRWLGESSTWSFSRKTLMVIRDHLKASDLPDVCINEESRAYDLDWGKQPFGSAAKFHNLPSIDMLPT